VSAASGSPWELPPGMEVIAVVGSG
jgi:hypothetical protein